MVEFYNQFNRLLLCLETPIVPSLGSKITIEKKIWVVQRIAYIINPSEMTVKIDLEPY